MSTKETTEDFYDITGNRLGNSSFLKMFNILEDDDNIKFLNIFRAYEINKDIFSDVLYYSTYEVDNEDYWDAISYKIYGIVDLWWALCLMNNIENPFEDLSVGNDLKVLKNSYLPQILKEIRAISER